MNDINMIHFVESSIRGGVSYINTKFLEAGKDSNEEIMYIDANVSHTSFECFVISHINFFIFDLESLWRRSNGQTSLQ